MKTNQVKLWKKILISSLALIGVGVLCFIGVLISIPIEKRQDDIRWYYQKELNDSLRADYDYPDKEYVRIYNTKQKRYMSPKMRWFSKAVSEGDSLTVFYDMTGKRGYINLHTGRVAIEGRYEHAWNFSEGLAAVCRDNKIGFINTAGEEVIPCQFPTTTYAINRFGYAFHDGYCVITNSKNECGLINPQGELVVDTIYDCIWNPSDLGVRIFQDEDKYGLMSPSGEILLPLYYTEIWCDGVNLMARKNGVMVELDTSGKVINPFCSTDDYKPMYLPSDYEYAHPTGYFKYFVRDREGVIDSNGKMVIPAIYYEINQLNDHLFEAKTCDVDYYYEAWVTIDIKTNTIKQAR